MTQVESIMDEFNDTLAETIDAFLKAHPESEKGDLLACIGIAILGTYAAISYSPGIKMERLKGFAWSVIEDYVDMLKESDAK